MRWGSFKRATEAGFHTGRNEVVEVVAMCVECEHG